MKKVFLRLLTFVWLTFFITSESEAAKLTSWDITSGLSNIEFVAIQDGSKINGSFKNFSGEILFDKTLLHESKIRIEIDLNSISMSFKEAVDTLKSEDWFDTRIFPKVIFQSKKISKISDDKFHVDGVLNMKGMESRVSFDFSFKEFSKNNAKAVGGFSLKRSGFGVGNADEKKANGVRDDVMVKFAITASAK